MNWNGGWNPWRTLRALPEVRLVWRQLRVGQRGQWQRVGGVDTIVIDPKCTRRERRAVLAHELVHLERGIGHGPASALTMEREESIVRAETARRLVPLELLDAYVRRECTVGPVTVWMVAEEFDVPEHVARTACDLLKRS